MDYIKYVDEDGKTILYSYDEFLKESWNLPYDFVSKVADENESLREQLFSQLFMRSAVQPYINMIALSPYYNELKNSIINGNDLEKKLHLVLYYEPNLLEPIFKNVDNLIDTIDSTIKNGAFIGYVGNYYIQISKLYKINESLSNKMSKSLDKASKYQVQTMDELLDGGKFLKLNKNNLKNIAEKTKEEYINIIKYNINKTKTKKLKKY